ncbi:hypothetical protein NKW45_00980 [Acetobacter orientalis]|uniref:hypothetical protein n=1 Tax=Acetobacter orientalis TaxID=146474 RepID=UPI0020A2DD92|nr:hypothetical protein [Acetobacter orientalis]MCP1220417.1 hypothetical protein [Acetobacter orientalis]
MSKALITPNQQIVQQSPGMAEKLYKAAQVESLIPGSDDFEPRLDGPKLFRSALKEHGLRLREDDRQKIRPLLTERNKPRLKVLQKSIRSGTNQHFGRKSRYH